MTERARRAALALHRQFSLTKPPISDGVVFMGKQKIWVRLTAMPSSVSGLLVREEGLGAVIWLRRSDPPMRRRFTLYHEVGHLLLHKGLCYCQVETGEAVAAEREADIFAAEFLMPREWVERECIKRGVDELVLADVFQVSVDAMTIRLRELEIL